MQLKSTNHGGERRRSQIGSQLPEEFYDYLDHRDLASNDRFLKRIGKRVFGVLKQPLLRRNRSNLTLLDSETDSNLSLAVTPNRAFSLRSQRTVSSKKSNPNQEISYMEDSKLSNGILPEKRVTKDDDILLHGEKTMIIKLEKENGEFGFNIVGGIDHEYIPGDPGIFISRIRNGSSASRDRRLKIGDRIISVNGILLTGKTHGDAVQILHSAKGSAVLMIEQDAESRVLNKPTELSGVVSSDESTSSKSEQQSLSVNTHASYIMYDSTKVEKKSALSPANKLVYLVSNSSNDDHADGEHLKKNKTESVNEINSMKHERISDTSVTTASPLTPLEDKTAKSIDELSEGPISLNSGDNHGSGYDYETDENALAVCGHSSSVIDDIPVTPKKPYRLLDPSNPSIFNEVLAVSAGIAALGLGIYVIYHFVKHRSP